MTHKLKSFAIGMAGAFDLTGSVFYEQYKIAKTKADARTKKLDNLRKSIDKSSTAKLNDYEAMRHDLEQVGHDMKKALTVLDKR
jgi:hypothetical protein